MKYLLILLASAGLVACSSTPQNPDTQVPNNPIPSTTVVAIPKDDQGNNLVNAFPVQYNLDGYVYTVECIVTDKGNVTCDWANKETR